MSKPLLLQRFGNATAVFSVLTGFSHLYNSTNIMVARKRRQEPRQAVAEAV
jgi:hypothetical protein